MALQGALCALLLSGPAHGYQLVMTLETELGDLWETRASQVYLTLARMERDQLVTSSRIPQPKRPDRQLLELTPKGRSAAVRWLWEANRDETVVRFAVARLVAPSDFEAIARSWLEERMAALGTLRELRRSQRGGFRRDAADAEIARVQGEVRWASSIVERASEIVAQPSAERKSRTRRSVESA